LAEDGKMAAGIGGGILVQQPGAIFVEFDLDGETAAGVNDLGRDDVGFRQDRFALDGDQHGFRAQHGNVLAQAGGIGSHFDVHAQDGGLGFLAGLAPAGQSQQEHHHQIDVESSRQSFHNGITKPQPESNVKTLMGKQSNKVENRSRRKRYLKRKKLTAKTKKAAKA
jgi:hypothetical protein